MFETAWGTDVGSQQSAMLAAQEAAFNPTAGGVLSGVASLFGGAPSGSSSSSGGASNGAVTFGAFMPQGVSAAGGAAWVQPMIFIAALGAGLMLYRVMK
jgi:hypothetical protein